MKKILYLNLLLSLFVLGCSSSVDENKVLKNYTNSEYFKSMEKLEQKADKTEADYTQLAINCHDLADESKDIKVTSLMADKIKKIRDNHFSNPTITAYYGSVYTLIGRDGSKQEERLSAVKKGISYIDEAVEKDSHNIHLRILRADNARYLPPFFNRIDTAVKDYQYITTSYENKKIQINKKMMSKIYLNQGDVFKRIKKIKDAIIAWKKVIKIDPESDNARQAKMMLSAY